MSFWCDNPREHQREGHRDYERGGRHGYDSRQYNDHFDDCAKEYRKGFDEARREDERREELREEMRRQEAAEERRIREWRQREREREEQMEEEYYQQQSGQQYEWEGQIPPEPLTPAEATAYLLLPSLKWSRKRRIKWCRRNNIPFKI